MYHLKRSIVQENESSPIHAPSVGILRQLHEQLEEEFYGDGEHTI